MEKVRKQVILFLVTALFGAFSLSTAALSVENPAQVVTRVEMLNKCPVYEEGDESSLLVGIAALLIPSLVESAVKGIGGAIRRAGEAKTFQTSDLYPISNFYKLNQTNLGFAANDNINCIVVFRAKVGNEMSKDYKKNSRLRSVNADDENNRYPVLDSLFTNFGIIEEPLFYYEAAFVSSPDNTAFRFEPKTVFYNDHIGDKSDDQLVLNVSFAVPSASAEPPVFAQYTVTFDRDGKSLLITIGATIESYGSGFMPLPPVSQKVSEALTLYKTQKDQLKQLEQQLVELEKKEDPDLAELRSQLIESKTAQASKAADIQKQIRRAIEDGESDEIITELKRKLEDALSDEAEAKNISRLEENIKGRIANITASAQRKNLTIAIPRLEGKIADSINLLNNATPINLVATLVETSNANKILVKIGEFLEGAAPKIKEKVEGEIASRDPKTQLESDVSLLTELNTLRTSAIKDVEAWRESNVAHEGSSDKASTLSDLRIAFFKARLSCDIVEKNGIVEPACLNLVVPPEN